jgi:hypothetical protein
MQARRRTRRRQVEAVDIVIDATEEAFDAQMSIIMQALDAQIGATVAEMATVGRMQPESITDALGRLLDNETGPFAQAFEAFDKNWNKYSAAVETREDLLEKASEEGLSFADLIDGETPHVWMCEGINTCPDCIVRHGWVASLDEIEAAGLPRSGFSVCDSNCKCNIEPLYYLRKKGITLNDVRRPVLQYMRGQDKTVTGLRIRSLTGVIANKGQEKIQAALDRSGQIGLEQRRFIRQAGRFAR